MIREGDYIKLKVLRLEIQGDYVRVVAKHDQATFPVAFLLPKHLVAGLEDIQALRRLVKRQAVRCPIHTNWTVRKGGLCKRWYFCRERGSSRCIALGPA